MVCNVRGSRLSSKQETDNQTTMTGRKRQDMCKDTYRLNVARIQSPAAARMVLLCSLLAAWMPLSGLAQNCAPGIGGNIQVRGPYAPPNDIYVHVGETATIQSLLIFDTGSCSLTNLK